MEPFIRVSASSTLPRPNSAAKPSTLVTARGRCLTILSRTACTVAERHHRITARAAIVDRPASKMPVAKANRIIQSSSLVRPHQFPIDGTRT